MRKRGIILLSIFLICLLGAANLTLADSDSGGSSFWSWLKDFFSGGITGAAVATPTSCGDVTGDLTLTADVSTTQDCFKIKASNIVLDCQGHNIVGNGVIYSYNQRYTGINITGYDNVTVKNCNTYNFSMGIYLSNSNSNTIINNNAIDYVAYGFFLSDTSSKNNLTQNTASSNMINHSKLPFPGVGVGAGFITLDSINNTFISNTANYNDYIGFHVYTSSNNSFISNTASYNKWGFRLSLNHLNNVLENNTANNNIMNENIVSLCYYYPNLIIKTK